MSWKRNAIEAACTVASRFAPRADCIPENPRSIFVLRNNDIGDLLVVTPLFEALRRRFPKTRIIAGVGAWNVEVLRGNPHVDEVLPINAPWHNGKIQPQNIAATLRYIGRSPEVAALAARKCDIGIDVLGSPQGSLLQMRAGISWRLGVRGYAGGHSAAQQCVAFDAHEHVGRMALRFAELLGATELPENRPQIYPSSKPEQHGAIVVAPGGGFAEKCWPPTHFAALLDRLAPARVIVIGGPQDSVAGASFAQGRGHVEDHTMRYSLAELFSVIAGARAVICNSSMAMHVAAAFRKPCLVVLGPHFADAAQHATQWAYPETRVLGRTSDHPEICSPEEVMPVLGSLLAPT
ncbi:glycosyl transferase family 9 [Chthoniobacter flavus Ellin428]|uniref:Glycosyl transferase family 9 n=1 Tax=Chthoniobacter flavus Ellin428 TaxID=497964 RepID=B4D1K1_9BACT|nr:glycosyltransferase family 9 protein [Chthoniobacter flavus]EDY19613.1 glycosyl transferase family 9 [Chthoniobacter flavus Ellin428]TCO92851.1 heptosyltransferase-2 [Chthoniobacter flavus]